MNIQGFDHVGFLVDDLEPIRRAFGELMGIEVGEAQQEPQLGVEILWVRAAGVALEFIRPTDPESRAARRLRAGHAGVDHVAFTVDEVRGALVEAREAGIATRDDVPRIGAHGAAIGFLDERSVANVRVEFVEPRRRELTGD
jgi:methylmalonyl-CoA/ethylmalonyl-CoA epimerase